MFEASEGRRRRLRALLRPKKAGFDIAAKCVTLGVTRKDSQELPLGLQMEISFKDKDLRRYAEDEAVAKRELGVEMAKKYRLRLVALLAAPNLATFLPPSRGPERCHELVGNLAGLFSMDLKQPYRLLFRPSGVVESDPNANLKQRWQSIISVVIIAIKDTHE